MVNGEVTVMMMRVVVRMPMVVMRMVVRMPMVVWEKAGNG